MPIFSDLDQVTGLKRLLLEAAPYNVQGFKSINNLAKILGVNRWSIQKWIKRDRIPAGRAKALVAVSEGRITLDDLDRYVYGPDEDDLV